MPRVWRDARGRVDPSASVGLLGVRVAYESREPPPVPTAARMFGRGRVRLVEDVAVLLTLWQRRGVIGVAGIYAWSFSSSQSKTRWSNSAWPIGSQCQFAPSSAVKRTISLSGPGTAS